MIGWGVFLFFPPNKMVNILILCGKSSLSEMSCASLLTRSLHPKPTRYITINFTRDGDRPSQNLHERNVMCVVNYFWSMILTWRVILLSCWGTFCVLRLCICNKLNPFSVTHMEPLVLIVHCF